YSFLTSYGTRALTVGMRLGDSFNPFLTLGFQPIRCKVTPVFIGRLLVRLSLFLASYKSLRLRFHPGTQSGPKAVPAIENLVLIDHQWKGFVESFRPHANNQSFEFVLLH